MQTPERDELEKKVGKLQQRTPNSHTATRLLMAETISDGRVFRAKALALRVSNCREGAVTMTRSLNSPRSHTETEALMVTRIAEGRDRQGPAPLPLSPYPSSAVSCKIAAAGLGGVRSK